MTVLEEDFRARVAAGFAVPPTPGGRSSQDPAPVVNEQAAADRAQGKSIAQYHTYRIKKQL